MTNVRRPGDKNPKALRVAWGGALTQPAEGLGSAWGRGRRTAAALESGRHQNFKRKGSVGVSVNTAGQLWAITGHRHNLSNSTHLA